MTLRSGFGKGFGGKVKVDFRIGGVHQAEQTLRDAFAIVHKALGYKIRRSQTDFPDYTLEDANGREIRAEVKEAAHMFKRKYDPEKCDLLICWRDDWPDCPIPKLVLSRYVQHKLLFEGFAGGEPPKVRALLSSPERLSKMLNSFYYLASDVQDLFPLDYKAAEALMFSGEALQENSSIESVKRKDRYFAELLCCFRPKWDYKASCLRLNVDFDDEVFEVRADIGQEVVERRGGRWVDTLSRVRDEGYVVKGELNAESEASRTIGVGESVELFAAVAEGSVGSVAFVKRFKFAEAFSKDPYDVVAGPHGELDSMLDFMEGEQLYVEK